MPTTTIRYDERVRDEATPLLNSMGMSLNTYLNLALNQLVVQRRVPFEIKAAPAAGAPRWRIVPEAVPEARVEGGRVVVPADWDDDGE